MFYETVGIECLYISCCIRRSCYTMTVFFCYEFHNGANNGIFVTGFI